MPPYIKYALYEDVIKEEGENPLKLQLTTLWKLSKRNKLFPFERYVSSKLVEDNKGLFIERKKVNLKSHLFYRNFNMETYMQFRIFLELGYRCIKKSFALCAFMSFFFDIKKMEKRILLRKFKNITHNAL